MSTLPQNVSLVILLFFFERLNFYFIYIQKHELGNVHQNSFLLLMDRADVFV